MTISRCRRRIAEELLAAALFHSWQQDEYFKTTCYTLKIYPAIMRIWFFQKNNTREKCSTKFSRCFSITIWFVLFLSQSEPAEGGQACKEGIDMKTIGSILAILISIFTSNSAICGQFDCSKPQFGAPITDINENNHFIKYSESGDVSYYNFTGPCVLPLHNHVVPSIVYGFVNNQLYARIIRTSNDSLDRILKHIPPSFGEPKRTQNGDVIQLSWENKTQETKLKIKFNTKTKEAKSVTYFQPLRPAVGASAMLNQ